MENKDFAVFIISHGRPDIVLTKKTLDKCGYTGSTYFVLDNEDKTIDVYKEKFGESAIIVFDKKKYADMVDEGNNFDNRSTTTHARNACFDIATTLGFNYFLVLDDDYYEFDYKFSGTKGLVMPKKIDAIFDLVLDFYKSTQALSVCFSQTGDFIGGVDNGKGVYRFSKRKAMNSFFCSTHRRFWFLGQLNEDVNTYTTLQSKGGLFLTIPVIAVNQKGSQSQKRITQKLKISVVAVLLEIKLNQQPVDALPKYRNQRPMQRIIPQSLQKCNICTRRLIKQSNQQNKLHACIYI